MDEKMDSRELPSKRMQKLIQLLGALALVLSIIISVSLTVITTNLPHWIMPVMVVWVAVVVAFMILYGAAKEKLNEYERKYGLNENQIKFLSEHDDLTGMYRRHAALEHQNRIPENSVYTVLMLDVDEFKEINDAYGHDFGDKVLVNLAEKIKTYTPKENSFIARYGSDEFLIVLFGQHVEVESSFLNNLRALIHEPIQIGLANIIPTVSIGIAYSDGRSDIMEILKHADIAVSESKRRGRKIVTVFSDAMEQALSDVHDIKNAVYDAITNDGLYMLYQPKVRSSDEAVVGYEALVRMKDESLSPGVFIPIAEENGWLREIGRITTEKVIRQLAAWRDDGKTLLPVSINFSTVQIRDTGCLGFLLELLAKYAIPSKYVELEITESILIEHRQDAVDLVERFRGAGIRILLDDFGTGYSSLSYLNMIPLDVIKVDKTFVDEYLKDEKKMVLLRDIIRLGHDLGAEIIVEGVETREQFIHLRDMDADVIQGFVFSRPLLPEEAIDFRPAAAGSAGSSAAPEKEA